MANYNPNSDSQSNNPLSNSVPQGVPDILQIGQPLDRQVDVEIETNLLDPVSHQFASPTGGTTTWVFPAKGVLDNRNAAVVFELNANANNEIGYPFHGGGLSCIRRATVRCGGVILSQCDNCAQYAQIKTNFNYTPDEKVGILDARHKSSNNLELRVAPAPIATGAADPSYHQLYNPECDQVDTFGKSYVSGAGNQHLQQGAKQLRTVAGTGPEVVIRLRDMFEFFDQPNRLPLFAMAQVELVIEWNACGNSADANGNNIIDSAVIQTGPQPMPANAAGRTNNQAVTMAGTPTLMLDYILYDEQERQGIQAVINSGQGMQMSFLEVVRTAGISPQASAATLAAGAGTTEVIQSNHILGMAGKEVHKIYVRKEYDIKSAQGAVEIDSIRNNVSTHRNLLLNQFKSSEIIGEQYNFLINNTRSYDRDISNKAVQHNYLAQCGGDGYNVPGCYFNTQNYNQNKIQELLDTSWTGAAATTDNAQGRTQRYLAGTQNLIGLNLAKINGLGPVPDNGQRISTAPIEFNYSRVALKQNGAADDMCGAVNLEFFLCYRKNLIITPTGVVVGDA